MLLCSFRGQNTARKINWTGPIPPVCLFLTVGIRFIGDKLTQCDLRSLKLGALTHSPLRVWSCSGSSERCHATVFFLSSSRLDLNREIGVKLSLPVPNLMLLTSYSCDDFCCSCCTVFAFYTPGLCHRTKTFTCGVEKAEKWGTSFPISLETYEQLTSLRSKILFYYFLE